MRRIKETISFYDSNADDFVAGTLEVDMSSLYAKFLSRIPKAGRILDAGCGSGRDSRYFSKQGYSVTAFDGSLEMVKRSSELIGLPVLHLKFDELEFDGEFDGVWACASVLHVSKSQMGSVLERLARAAIDQGVIYLSFKYGIDEEVRGGRHFSNYTEETFLRLLESCPTLQPLELWKTGDVRPGREHEMWLNILLRKTGQGSIPP